MKFHIWNKPAIFALSLTFAATSALAAPSASSSPQEKSAPQAYAEDLFNKGVDALIREDYVTAEKSFGEVLGVVRDHPEANYYMGMAKVGREKHKSSVRYFKRAIKERSDFVEAREQLALVYITLGKTAEAQEQLSALHTLKQTCETEECATVFVERTDRAISRVSSALGGGAEDVSYAPQDEIVVASRESLFDHNAANMRYSAAQRMINMGEYKDAIDSLREAQSLIGPHPDILNYLGYANRKIGNFGQAKSFYAAALKLEPDHLGATEYLGELYVEMGDLNKARRQLARLDALCAFGCAEREDLARLIEIKESERYADR